MPLTYPYATLRNYQNTFIYKSKLKTHPNLISHANKEYVFIAGAIMTHRSIDSLIIKFWNWLNIPL